MLFLHDAACLLHSPRVLNLGLPLDVLHWHSSSSSSFDYHATINDRPDFSRVLITQRFAWVSILKMSALISRFLILFFSYQSSCASLHLVQCVFLWHASQWECLWLQWIVARNSAMGYSSYPGAKNMPPYWIYGGSNRWNCILRNTCRSTPPDMFLCTSS